MSAKLLYQEREMEWDDLNENFVSAAEYYLVDSAADEESAIASALESSDTELQGMRRSGASVDSRVNAGTWKICVRYSRSASASSSADKLPAESTSYSVGTATAHATQSLETVHRYGNSLVDYHGAIDVQDGEIRGIDILTPATTMTITHCFSRAQFSRSLRDRIILKACRTNDGEFRGFPRGSLLYAGASITQQGSGVRRYYQVEYTFMVSPKAENMAIAGFQTNVDKRGWDAMWIAYERKISSGLLLKPKQVNIERVYHEFDFTTLGLSRNE